MIATAEPSDTQIRREFEKMLPELISRLRYRFFSNDPDLQEEHIAEAIAISWGTYVSARRRGREPSAGNLAWYSTRCVLSGRRLTGATSLDALSETRAARERIGEHTSLDDFEGDPQRAFYRVFGDRRWRWPVVDVVGAKLDWQAFISRCDRRDQRIVKMKLAGCPQTEIAATLGISPPAVCLRLRALRRRWDTQAVA